MMNVQKFISQRVKEFEELGNKGYCIFDFKPFIDLRIKATLETELLFCISTANSSAIAGLRFQKFLEDVNLENLSRVKIESLLKKAGVRFYNRKSEYIQEVIQKLDIISKIVNLESSSAREVLLKLKGIGMKEASHFLRNIGRKDVAIIDRHILNWLFENNHISNVPVSLSKKKYLEIENILKEIANQKKMSLAELDLYLWYQQTGKVLK